MKVSAKNMKNKGKVVMAKNGLHSNQGKQTVKSPKLAQRELPKQAKSVVRASRRSRKQGDTGESTSEVINQSNLKVVTAKAKLCDGNDETEIAVTKRASGSDEDCEDEGLRSNLTSEGELSDMEEPDSLDPTRDDHVSLMAS